MKKICILFLAALLLTGCKTVYEIRPDTIVDIPLKPTEPEVTELTQPPTEAPTWFSWPEIPTDTWEPTTGETAPPTRPQSYDPGGYIPGGLDRAVAEAVNAARRDTGLEPLVLDARLCAIASVRAWECSTLLSGIRPNGRDGITVLDEYGYAYGWAAENLFYGAGSADTIVSRWMDVDGTRERLLMAGTVIGVASYTDPSGVTYVAALIVG